MFPKKYQTKIQSDLESHTFWRDGRNTFVYPLDVIFLDAALKANGDKRSVFTCDGFKFMIVGVILDVVKKKIGVTYARMEGEK